MYYCLKHFTCLFNFNFFKLDKKKVLYNKTTPPHEFSIYALIFLSILNKCHDLRVENAVANTAKEVSNG